MRLIADENVSARLVHRLRELGYRVDWIAETAPGTSDPDILAIARNLDAALVTFDRDFGELVFARGARPPRNILYSRRGRAEPEEVAGQIAALLEEGLPVHQMVTFKRDSVRFAAFPPGATNG